MNFIEKHPIITNLLGVIVVFLLLTWGVLSWLHSYTRHDKTVVIPANIIGMPLEEAKSMLTNEKLRYEDEIEYVYDKKASPGTICKVWPLEGTNVKEGRKLSLTVYSNDPPQINMPEVKDMSQRQALALLKSIGYENILVTKVDGPYQDLVVGLESNGNPVNTGMRYHSNIPLTLLVSSGNTLPEYPFSNEDGTIVEDNPSDESWF